MHITKLNIVVGFVFLLFLGIVFMWVFNLCPPEGPWPKPPWCTQIKKEATIEDKAYVPEYQEKEKAEDLEKTQEKLQPVERQKEEQEQLEEKQEKPEEKPKEKIHATFVVTIPYWIDGNIYLALDSNYRFLKLEKVNAVTYKGEASLEEGTEYFYTLNGKIKSKERFVLKHKVQLDAVIDWEGSNKRIIKKGFYKGVTFGAMKWDSWQKQYLDAAIDALDEFYVNSIIIIPDWFVFPGVEGTEIKPYYDEETFPNPTGWITPTLTDDELRSIIRKVKKKGIKVILKPHVDTIDFGMKKNSCRGCLRPKDWDKWFENYEKFILHYASLAEDENVDLFVIGTELDTSITQPKNSEKKWRNIIKKVRAVYSGPITYSVSCHQACFSPSQIKFWDALDYIGFEPYFGLTDKNNPTIEEMKNAFKEKLNKFAKPLYEKYKKPIIFTETNVYSWDGVNKEPIGIGNIDTSKAKPDYFEQAAYYEAVFQAIENIDWVKGVIWWAWYLDSVEREPYLYAEGDIWDSFVRKPAGQVMKKWFGKIES